MAEEPPRGSYEIKYVCMYVLRLAFLRTPVLTCDGNLRFKHFWVRRDNRLTGNWQNMTKFLNILFSNSFGRISRVTESTFIITRSDGRMVITCRTFKHPITGSLPDTTGAPASLTERQFFPGYKHFAYCFSEAGV